MSCIFMALLCSMHSSTIPQQSGSEIIRDMEAMYAHLQTYSDEGTLTGGSDKMTFKTTFKSPGRLYFQYTEGTDTWFLCASGKKNSSGALLADAYVQGKVEHNTLELEVAGFTGISLATAYNVPTMLFPGMSGRQFHDFKDAALIRTESMGGEKCFVVESKDNQETLWIGTKTHALWKLVETGRVAKTITYTPKLNPKVEEGVFVFKPPSG